MDELSHKLKDKILEHLKSRRNQDEIILRSGRQSWTSAQMIEEINNETEVGIKFLTGLLNLTIDMLARNKEKI